MTDFIIFQWMRKSSSSDTASDCINRRSPYLRLWPNGAPAGCCCFLYHLCWHGERQLRGPRAPICLQNRKNTLLSDARWRQKTNHPGSRGTRQQLRKMITGGFSAGAEPFSAHGVVLLGRMFWSVQRESFCASSPSTWDASQFPLTV